MRIGILIFLFFPSYLLAQNYQDTLLVSFDSIEVSAGKTTRGYVYYQNKIITNQRSRDLAGTFEDPSRTLFRHSGISTVNDQANGVSYRGLPSHLTKWSIYGSEIVNPNHLSNAGTRNDQSSLSAGGVLAIPFDVIDQFSFSPFPFNEPNLNSVAGVMNFEFQNQGNNYIKTGLLGMEGGVQVGNVRLHGRYSTVGLLSDLGVDFDNESIKFQDLFISTKLSESTSFFSIIASSTNRHSSVDSLELAELEKDIMDINYESLLSIQGIHYNSKNVNHSLVFSYKNDSRVSLTEWPIPNTINPYDSTRIKNLKLAYSGDYRINNAIANGLIDLTLKASYNSDEYYFDLESSKQNYLYVKPSISLTKFIPADDATNMLKLIFSAPFDSYTNDIIPEPALIFQRSKGMSTIEFKSQLSSHLLEPVFVLAQAQRAQNLSTNLSWKLRSSRLSNFFSVDLFYNYYFNGMIEDSYSPIFNYLRYDGLKDSSLAEAKGRSYGIELKYAASIGKQWDLNCNTTLFDAQYKNQQDTWFNMTNNYGYIFNLGLGKRFELKNDKRLLLHLASHYRGGAYDTNFENNSSNEIQLSSYWRTDMRVKYNFSDQSALILDIQNVFNNINEAYRYYDHIQNDIIVEEQLGMIPILSYKHIFN